MRARRINSRLLKDLRTRSITTTSCNDDKRPIDVLALVAGGYGERGGIAQATRDLIRALAGNPDIANIQVLPRHVSQNSYDIPDRVRQLPPVSNNYLYTLMAMKISLSRKPAIVYCGHAFMAPAAFLAARIAGAHLVSHVHGLEVWQPLSRAAQLGLARSDIILCVSRHTMTRVVDTVGADPSRCAVIYNTVGDRFVPCDPAIARARLGIPSDAVVLSTVSRLDPSQRHKGHDRVIPLLADLARDVPGLIYLIAGTGGDRERLEALASATGAAGIVRFLGFVPDTELPDLYCASDLYVMPSHGEGFGISFVEAMACGTPALGLDLGGAGDALRNGELGRAVTEADFPAALRAALTAGPIDRVSLAAQTRAIFGPARFAHRLADAMITLQL